MALMFSGSAFRSIAKAPTRAPAKTPTRAIAVCILSAVLSAGLIGCSTSREPVDDASRLGNDQSAGRLTAPQREQWRQPSAFDSDGPPANTYRGGRDPITNRADNNWPPAAPPQSQPYAPPPSYAAPQQPRPYAPPPSYRTAAPAPAPYAATPPSAPLQPSYGGGPSSASSVEVRPGDTLYRIARAHNVTVPELMQANGLQSESIRVGQRISIPSR